MDHDDPMTPEEHENAHKAVWAVGDCIASLGIEHAAPVILGALTMFVLGPFKASPAVCGEVAEEMEQLLAQRACEIGGLNRRN